MERITIDPTGMEVEDGSIHMLLNNGRDGLSVDARGICNGRNSGYQAVNIAVLAGAQRIILLGYDGRVIDGKTHCFPGGHPDKTHGGLYAKEYRSMVEPLRKLGVEVLNCTPGSAIDAFPKVDLCRALTA